MNPVATQAATTLPVGIHQGVPMETYLALDALGSTRLEWLAVSALHYRYMVEQPRESTPAADLGTALHMAVLEPEQFSKRYVLEPDPALVAPGNVKPRATNAYKTAVAFLEEEGKTVLTGDVMAKVLGMAESIQAHPHAAALLARASEREVTAVWERDGILCRARADLLGKGVIGDIKTTNRLKDFSPWTITRRGYYRQMAHYVDGFKRLGHPIEHVLYIAVESAPPHDVGVFALDEATVSQGLVEVEYLMDRLARCQRSGVWPGMYPEIQQALLSDAIALQLAAEGEDF